MGQQSFSYLNIGPEGCGVLQRSMSPSRRSQGKFSFSS